MVAQRLKISYPIVLVVGGLLLSFVPVLSRVEIEPEQIFVIFLPPILYEAAWSTTWKDFWKWRRIIFSYAFFIVMVTSTLVAVVSSNIIPGFTLALGFLLGGIVSPPDAVSATSIMREVDVPKRISAIIEGESLLNDASSIIVFRFALAAVATGSFVFSTAATSFVLVIVMGALIGLGVALVFYAIHRLLPTTASIDLVFTLVTPYLMYLVAEHFHYSGVLAVVTGGLFLANKRQVILSPLSRIQGGSVWGVLGFVLNGLVFMLIGLQMPVIVQKLDVGLGSAIFYSGIIAAVLIVSRLLIALATSAFTMFISRFITTADARPGFRAPIILGWAGMRGVVSLAAALSIPVYINNNVPFPQRNLILFITFSVILITLVLQGLTLPLVIKLVKLKDPDYKVSDGDQELMLQKSLTRCAINKLETVYKANLKGNPMLQAFAQRMQNNLELFNDIDTTGTNNDLGKTNARDYEKLRKEIIEAQRELLLKINAEEGISEEIIRRFLLALDKEEELVKEQVKLF